MSDALEALRGWLQQLRTPEEKKLGLQRLRKLIGAAIRQSDGSATLDLTRLALELALPVEGVHYLRGVGFFLRGDLDAARRVLEEELTLFPGSCQAQALLHQVKDLLKTLGLGPVHPCWRIPQPCHAEAVVLMNGPSAAPQLNEIIDYKFCADIHTVNFMPNTEPFQTLAPHTHYLVDPNYFKVHEDQDKNARIRQLFATLHSLPFPLCLAVPRDYVAQVEQKISNPQVSVIGLPQVEVASELSLEVRNYLLRHGNYGFGMQGVAVSALGLALLMGYKKIWLAGAEHTYLKNWHVDKHCRSLLWDPHSYDLHPSQPLNLNTFIRDELRSSLRLYDQLYALRAYADFCGTQIINLSLESMLDMFPKGLLGQEPFVWRPEETKDS